jgi:hypothetical protein
LNHFKNKVVFKLQFDRDSILTNQKFNDDFKSHIIIEGIQERLLTLLINIQAFLIYLHN